MSKLTEESKHWYEAATELLKTTGIVELLNQFGETIITGSYDYDLMFTGTDIDLFVSNPNPSRQLAEDILVALTKSGHWNSQMYCDWMTLPSHKAEEYPELPLGHFFCVKKEFKGTRWKVDIFLVDPDELAKRLKPKPIYNDEQKEIILTLKEARNKGEFPAELSSQLFYDAVLESNIASVEEFKIFVDKTTPST